MRYAVVVFVALSACGPVESRLASGTFAAPGSAQAPLEGATLTIDLSGKSGALRLGDGTTVALELAPIAREGWPNRCPTQMSSKTLESWDITPAPLVIKTLSLAEPKLRAGCLEDSREALVEGKVDDEPRTLVFQQLTR